MTAITANSRLSEQALRPIHFIGLILALVLIGAYYLLPFVNQPELGPTTIPVLIEGRANNEFELATNGLSMIPLAGLGALLLGIWCLVSPRHERVVSILLSAAGVVALVYFVIFFREYTQTEGANYLGNMAVGFWVMLAGAVLLVIQFALPRASAGSDFSIRSVLGNQEMVLVAGLVMLVALVGIANPRFLADRNLSDVLQGHAYIAVAAIGMTMVIITGNIDISIGSLVGLLAIISGRIAADTGQIWLAWTAPLLIGAFSGGVTGFLVAYMRIPSIVVTLGMLSILKGLLLIWTAGSRVVNLPEGYFLAQMRPLNIPMPVWFMIVLTVLAALWMRYSGFGRSIYAVGGNKEAARLSGLNEPRIVFWVFVLNGFFVGIASVLYATQLTIIQATPPPGLELTVITSAVVGGVSILGGTGTVLGAMVAAILLNAIRSAMVFINVSPFWLQAVQGLLILVTVLADLLRRRRQRL